MHATSWVTWEELGWGTKAAQKLAQAHTAGKLGPRLRAPAIQDLTTALNRNSMSAELVEELCSETDPDGCRGWRQLQNPQARAVVTGQQPGCAGGVLLVLYKAATAIALSRRASTEYSRPVIPIFWNATDDVDFDEIARVAWPSPHGLLFLELPQAGREAEGFVGRLPAHGDLAASAAALGLLDESSRLQLQQLLPQQARDHGDWVSQLLRNVFQDLVVLDARSPALRRHAAGLFRDYLQRIDVAQAAVEETAVELEAAGFARTLSPASLRSGLFLTPNGARRKSTTDMQPLERALASAPESVSPNVVLRPFVQDHLLPTIATVVGPSEIGYLLELRRLRKLLQVPEPALIPRLSCTILEPPTWESAMRLGLPAAALLRDPEETLRLAAQRAARKNLDAISSVFADFETGLEHLQDDARLRAPFKRSVKRAHSLRQELEVEIVKSSLQSLQESDPGLTHLHSVVRPRGKPQERLVAALWLLARWGPETGPRLVELAEQHLDSLRQQRSEHALVIA